MDKAFLAAYSLRLVATCHRRGAFAMGGMSAFIPVKGDEAANAGGAGQGPRRQAARGRQRPRRHLGRASGAGAGRDGGVRGDARPNQLSKMPEHVPGRDEMLKLHEGARTEAGARENIRVGVQYLAAWLGGKGAVPLYNLMEDAATAEICRTQLWQWLKFEAPLDDGRALHPRPVRAMVRRGGRPARRSAQHRRSRAADAQHDRRRRPRRIPDAAGLRAAGLRSSRLADRGTRRVARLAGAHPAADRHRDRFAVGCRSSGARFAGDLLLCCACPRPAPHRQVPTR